MEVGEVQSVQIPERLLSGSFAVTWKSSSQMKPARRAGRYATTVSPTRSAAQGSASLAAAARVPARDESRRIAPRGRSSPEREVARSREQRARPDLVDTRVVYRAGRGACGRPPYNRTQGGTREGPRMGATCPRRRAPGGGDTLRLRPGHGVRLRRPGRR